MLRTFCDRCGAETRSEYQSGKFKVTIYGTSIEFFGTTYPKDPETAHFCPKCVTLIAEECLEHEK